jgi:hypothetical protein
MPEILDFPFFTLEYRNGFFARLIPAGVRDMGGGLFALKGKTWKLPGGAPAAALAKDTVKGRPLLSLLKRGPESLIKNGPRLAEDAEGERLTELVLAGGRGRAFPAAGAVGAGPLYMEMRLRAEEAEWLPLTGLPRHRLYRNVVYEVIDETALAEFAEPRGCRRYALKGEDIPRFADSHGRMIFQFGDQKLKERLAEDSVFVNRERLSLILGALREQGRGGTGEAWAAPLLRYGGRRFSVEEVSLRMNRDYILLEDQWVRREDLLAAGLFPLCSWAGGAAIEKIKLKPGELLRRGGGRFAGRFSGMEADTTLWLERGDKEAVFHAHLEFLRAWGLSGGALVRGHREHAAFLASALARLASCGCNALALMERRYHDLYLSPFLPEIQAAQISLPGTDKSRSAPLRVAFYEELPLSPAERRNAAGILLLVEPEEALPQNGILAHLQSVRAEITLGIFSDTRELFRGPAAAKARNLFGVTEAELEPYLIRDAARPLSLPRFEFPPPRVFRPSDFSAKQNPFNYSVEEKFAALPGPSLYSELALFNTGGPPARFIPLRLLKGSLDIERMDEDELAFFVYWRSEFRRGNIIKTGEGYIRIYARELCLFTGGENDADTNFRELLKLWEYYRAVFDGLDGFLPRWLVDFAVLYEITDKAFPLLLPYARDCNDPLLTDFYFHRRFIRENNSIGFADVALLIPKVIGESLFFEQEPSSGTRRFPAESHLLAKDFENTVNAVDRYLREEFRLKLFEFFYPQVYDTENREAFPAMERAGHSSYIIEGLRFTKHPPLTGFLENLFRYTEYCFRLKNGLEMKGRTPPLGEVWKSAADSALGAAGAAPLFSNLPVPVLALHETGRAKPGGVSPSGDNPQTAPPAAGGRQMKLLESRIAKLRVDSDAVRDLLKPEEEEQNSDTAVPPARGEIPGGQDERKRRCGPLKAAKDAQAKSPDKAAMKGFLKGLDKTGRETLRIIAGEGKTGLEDFARKNGTMPELLTDRINAAFLEQFADLLIDTVDEKPAIQSEYSEILKNLLGTAAGN